MSIIALTLGLSLTSSAAQVATGGEVFTPPRCSLTPRDAVCRDTPRGVVIGPAGADGEQAILVAAAEAAEAEQTWTTTFGSPPPAYAVILDQAASSEDLRTAGAQRVLPWLSPSARRRALERGIRETLSRQAPAGQSDAIANAAIQQAAPQIEASVVRSSQPGVMAHELGHLWYIQAYWNGVASSGDAYGSPAPDWLDEAAAVLMEGDSLTRSRRAAFRALPPETSSTAFVSTLFGETHPAFASGATTADLTAGGSSGSRVMTMTGEEFQRRTGTDIGAAAAFYARVRAFVDFIEAKTGDHRALVRLTAHLRSGGSVSDWFAEDPAGRQLGGSVTAADDEFDSWSKQGAAPI